jgi:hypothetical protein
MPTLTIYENIKFCIFVFFCNILIFLPFVEVGFFIPGKHIVIFSAIREGRGAGEVVLKVHQ